MLSAPNMLDALCSSFIRGIITNDSTIRPRTSTAPAGVKFLDGRDPDGNRILVAYPSPLQLPRHIIADRFE